jgi:thiol-disulfide isomerase/thioredoxin
MKMAAMGILFWLLPMVALGQASKPPPLQLRDINGRQFRLSDYKGKIILINFWATWCPPCRVEIPELIRLQRKYRANGLQVIGVAYPPEELAKVRRFARRAKINYPVMLGTRETKLLFTPSETLPMTIVIGRDGNIRDIIEGIVLPEEFEREVLPLLE